MIGPSPRVFVGRQREMGELEACLQDAMSGAQELVISLNTVLRHVSHIFAKTSTANLPRRQRTLFAKAWRIKPSVATDIQRVSVQQLPYRPEAVTVPCDGSRSKPTTA